MIFDLISRVLVFLVLLVSLGISASFRKRAREEGGMIERREEGWSILFIRMLLGLSLLSVLLLGRLRHTD